MADQDSETLDILRRIEATLPFLATKARLAGRPGLLTGIEGASSRPVRRIVLMAG